MKSSLLLKQAFVLGVIRAAREVGLAKIAVDTNDLQAAGMLGGGGLLAAMAPKRLLGLYSLYHGTPSAEMAAGIRREGLIPGKAVGAAQHAIEDAIARGNRHLVQGIRSDVSKHIYMSPSKRTAKGFSTLESAAPSAGIPDPKYTSLTEQSAAAVRAGDLKKARRLYARAEKIPDAYDRWVASAKDRTIKANVPFGEMHKFEVDPEFLATGHGRAAVRRAEALAPEFIVGGKGYRLRNILRKAVEDMPRYIKARTGRFAAGLGLLGGGGYLAAKGLKGLLSRKEAGLSKLAISLYAPPFANSFQAPEQRSQMNLGDLVGSGHAARSPFASSLLKASALESRTDPRPSPAGDFQQAPSAGSLDANNQPKPEGPLVTDGWITTGQTTKEPARNAPISLL
jgi:hypothetical protein